MDYKNDLAQQLPQLKNIDGFPIGKDEDIIALSQPPYYTACPNPYINQFIEQHGTPYNPQTDNYHCEPFVGDVSEGKNDPIYMAHSYHTKVPHKAIMQYIKHYTKEGDIVLDGFCGSGMTGVACNQLNRVSILSDISPIASFLASNFTSKIDAFEFTKTSNEILRELKKECGWMYETIHSDGKTIGMIDYTIWSDVFMCPYCGQEHIYWEEAIAKNNFQIRDQYNCPSCNAMLNKTQIKHVFEIFYDPSLNKNIEQAKKVVVQIHYTIGTQKFPKTPDNHDIETIEKIQKGIIPYWYPTYKIMNKDDRWGDLWVPAHHKGITHCHHFYFKRNLWVLAALYNKLTTNFLLFQFTSITLLASKLQRWRPEGKSGILTGTLYIASLIREENIMKLWNNKIKALSKIKISPYKFTPTTISTQSATSIANTPSNSIDYIFTDPPFGRNIMYSEASFIWENWLKVLNNNNKEAIINKSQNKKLPEYFSLMYDSFKEFYRILKPKRWITIEFHNAKSSVWKAIQEAITKAGFIIAQVTLLDKKTGSYKQVTAPNAVSNDLVISAYKPSEDFEQRFLQLAGKDFEAAFVQQHLDYLPKEPTIERTEKMLYSKMLSYYILHGYEIGMNAKNFYQMLQQKFVEIDGFWFNPEQVSSYNEFVQNMNLQGIPLNKLFLYIYDEKSALTWLYQFLSEPKTFSDISVAFTQLAHIQNDNMPELLEVLEQNFVTEEGKYRRPKAGNEHSQLTEKRERVLQREFEGLLLKARSEKAKIKQVRKEALVFGFEWCYRNKRFNDIIDLSQKLDKAILESSPELTEFVDAAEIMLYGV